MLDVRMSPSLPLPLPFVPLLLSTFCMTFTTPHDFLFPSSFHVALRFSSRTQWTSDIDTACIVRTCYPTFHPLCIHTNLLIFTYHCSRLTHIHGPCMFITSRFHPLAAHSYLCYHSYPYLLFLYGPHGSLVDIRQRDDNDIESIYTL